MKCQKCKYQTCCTRALLEHSTTCTGSANVETSTVSTLDCEMHCICGFSSSEGNALARHLASCERRSAYASVELAQENTVKRNMLDMLGLVRRDDDDDESDDLLLPANRRGNVESDDESRPAEEDSSNAAAPSNVDAQAEHEETHDQQFNTQLSLDDLAPGSVAPQPETDRTPQLSDEYQVII